MILNFNAAKRALCPSSFGDAIVTNTYLRVALPWPCRSLQAGLIYANVKTARNGSRTSSPWVIRINDIGAGPRPVNYSTFAYKPQEAEIKYFT